MESRRLIYFAPLLAAMLTAGALEWVHVLRTPTISADGIIFIRIAQALTESPIETFRQQDQHPGYPAMLLAATRVAQWLGYEGNPDAWMLGGVIASGICGVLCVPAIWLLTRTIFDERVANVAAMAYAVLPIPVWLAGDAHSDTPHLMCYLLAAWLAALGMVHGRAWPLAAAGATSALAYWIRPEGLEVFLVALVCVVWQAFRADWTWKHLGAAVASLAAVTVIVAAPYPILAHKFTSKQLPFAKPHPVRTYISQVATEPAPAASQPAVAAAAAPTASDDITPAAPPAPAAEPLKRYRFGLVLKHVGKGMASFVNSFCQGLKFAFVPFYLLGNLALMWRKAERVHVGFLALLGLTHFAALMGVYLLSGYIAHRHVLPVVGLTMPITALGLVVCGEYLAARWQARPQVATLLLLGVTSLAVLPYTVRAINREFVPVIEATRWVMDRAEPGMGVVSNSPYVAFYGNLPVTFLSSQAPTLHEALSRADTDARFDYVVLHVNAHDYHPEWLEQLAPYYRQVQLFADDHPTARPKKVLVFEAKQGHVRRPGRRQS